MNQKQIADKVIYNGKIYTVDAARSKAQAVAFKGDTILAVGTNEDILAISGPDTEKFDVKGKLVLPGFNDSHTHVCDYAQEINNVDLSKATTIAEIISTIAERAKVTPKGEWISAQMAWHEAQLVEQRLPTRFELDVATPDNPLFVPRGGHVCVANSKALEIAGITKETANPPRGIICRDEEGRPNGVMIESARPLVENHVPKISREKYNEAFLKCVAVLNSIGLTAATDCAGFGRTDEEDDKIFNNFIRLSEEGRLNLRTSVLCCAPNLESTKDEITKCKKMKSNEYFKFAGIKLFQDGGVEGANMKTPYQIVEITQPDPKYCGVPFFGNRVQEFSDILQLAALNGLQVQTHAVGDAAIEFVVNHYAAQNQKTPIKDLRWTVCHIMLPSQQDIDKIIKNDIVTTVQNHPYLMGGNMEIYWGKERANRCMPLRTLLKNGVTMGGGTDLPVLPASPFISIEWMVDRKFVGGKVLGAEEAITVEEAIYLYTMGSAFIEGWDKMIGSIEPGKKADVIVLNQDILTVPTSEIKNTTVNTTFVGGKAVYQE
jgi:predicted amidohydrolase YtcJ